MQRLHAGLRAMKTTGYTVHVFIRCTRPVCRITGTLFKHSALPPLQPLIYPLSGAAVIRQRLLQLLLVLLVLLLLLQMLTLTQRNSFTRKLHPHYALPTDIYIYI